MLPIELYYESLESINEVKFTPREIDIIACILNGRSAKTIPSLLSIAPKTVSTHIENIRSKIGCSSRESIIDFVEKSDKYSTLKNTYYSSLLSYNIFEKSLKEVFKVVSSNSPASFFICQKENQEKQRLIHNLIQHLKLAGFKIKSKENKKKTSLNDLMKNSRMKDTDYILYITPELEATLPQGVDSNTEKQNECVGEHFFSLENLIFLTTKKSEDKIDTGRKIKIVDFSNPQTYYDSFCHILKITLPHEKMDKIFFDFNQKIKALNFIDQGTCTTAHPNHTLTDAKVPSKNISLNMLFNFLGTRKSFFMFFIVCLFIFYFSYEIIKKKEIEVFLTSLYTQETTPIRSELIIPTPSTFLNRPELIAQIDSQFEHQEGIKSVALVGIGGAGKTTLARQYARQQKATLVWEINAETQARLNTSFENLGEALSKSDTDKKALKVIQDIKDAKEREEKLILLVREHLRVLPNWLLIFDNVENWAEIQKYIPQDSHMWGKGKVILTSRNYNLQNNNQIEQALVVDKLDSSQRVALFTQIMRHANGAPLTNTQKKEVERFLEQIPPFPLDISVAAYYLKTANISYTQYLENIKKNTEEFDNFQSDIIKEYTNYSKTRYGIISTSLKEIIGVSEDFKDLLLFISLLDSQNIPIKLLSKYKNNISVDSFILHLKKYSFITNEDLSSFPRPLNIFFHNSIQDIIRAYLRQQCTFEEEKVNVIANTLDDYVTKIIEDENFQKMKIMARHLEKFLEQRHLLSELSVGFLESKLSSIYYFINDDRYRQILESSLSLVTSQPLKKFSSMDRSRLARSLLQIGNVYTELRFYKEAQQIFEKVIRMCDQGDSKNLPDLSWALTHLGNVHRRLGNYEKAKELLEESTRLQKQYGKNDKRIARTLAYLGSVYKNFDFFPEAIKILEESLALYKRTYSDDHFRVGWISLHLGSAYYKLGRFQESLRYLEKSLDIHQKHFDKNHIRIGWVLFHLANTHKAMAHFPEASKLFDKVLSIYALHCNEETLEAARLLRNMARIYLEKNSLEEAENFAIRSLKILQKYNHVDTYKSFKALGEIYLKKSIHPAFARNPESIQSLKNKARGNLREALRITQRYFSSRSFHSEKIQNRIKSMDKD